MSQGTRRYCQSGLLLCALSLMWTASSAAPREVQDQGWGRWPRSAADAARFLEYSTWGPNAELIEHLQRVGYERFLEEQFAAPVSSYPTLPPYPAKRPRDCDAECRRDNYTLYPLQTRFYINALYAPDQLRQRVAFALHQIMVVSGLDIRQPSRLSPYLQILDRSAFGNFRQLLQEITLNAAMGSYLDMAGNSKANPNENYAREVLQLFSIGLNQLNSDGSPAINQYGQTIPSYDQNVVNAFARVFTGWIFAPSSEDGVVNYLDPMIAVQRRHDIAPKALLQGVTLPANQTAGKDLSDALDNIFLHPNVGPFVSKQLIQHLVTSNPSPSYVQRAAEAFADNGQGERGDLQAVIRAILLDEEAAAIPGPAAGKGHLKHPVLFLTNLLRALNARSADGTGPSDGYLNPLNRSMGMDLFAPPSVFSYFSLSTPVPGSDLRGPEFGLLNTSATIRLANVVNRLVFSVIATSRMAPKGTSLDLSALESLAGNPERMVQSLNTLMMSGRMSPEMANGLVAAVQTVPAGNIRRRAQTAVYLIATSAQYQVSR